MCPGIRALAAYCCVNLRLVPRYPADDQRVELWISGRLDHLACERCHLTVRTWDGLRCVQRVSTSALPLAGGQAEQCTYQPHATPPLEPLICVGGRHGQLRGHVSVHDSDGSNNSDSTRAVGMKELPSTTLLLLKRCNSIYCFVIRILRAP